MHLFFFIALNSAMLIMYLGTTFGGLVSIYIVLYWILGTSVIGYKFILYLLVYTHPDRITHHQVSFFLLFFFLLFFCFFSFFFFFFFFFLLSWSSDNITFSSFTFFGLFFFAWSLLSSSSLLFLLLLWSVALSSLLVFGFVIDLSSCFIYQQGEVIRWWWSLRWMHQQIYIVEQEL